MDDTYKDLEKLSDRSFQVARAGLITTFAAATVLVTGVYGEDAWKIMTREKEAGHTMVATRQSPAKDIIFNLSLVFGLVGMGAGFGGIMMNTMANIDLDQMDRTREKNKDTPLSQPKL